MNSQKFTLINIVNKGLEKPHIALLSFLLLICIYIWFLAIEQYPLNPDAGYYLTAGKYIVGGLVPFQDFHTSYSPGTFYIFALMELAGSAFGNYQKLFIYLLHLLNGFLLSLVLLRLNFNKNLAFTGGVLLVLAVFSLDGQAVVLEPFQNVFIIASLLAAISLRDKKAAVIAGICLGCGLMAKQSSMFSMPVIAMLIAFPYWFGIASEKTANSKFISRTIIFGTSIGVPFVVFCLLTKQSFITAFIQLATFGGGAKGYVGLKYTLYDVIDTFLIVGDGSRLLIPMAIITGLVLLLSKNNLHRLLVVGFVCNFMTVLFIRGYPHYIQLLMPWAILLTICLVKLMKEQSPKHESIIVILAIIPFIAPVLSTAHKLRIQFSKAPVMEQVALSNAIAAQIGEQQHTIIVGDPWLYYTNNIVPNDNHLGFIKTIYHLEEKIHDNKYIIVMPQQREIFAASKGIENFTKIGSAPYYKDSVNIYQSIND